MSDTFTNLRLPFTISCFSSTGSNMGSISSSTPVMISAMPSPMHSSSLSFSFESPSVVCPNEGTFWDSLFLIQLSAWPCGSIISGNRLERVTKIPFWMDRGSAGRPCMFQSPMVPMSTMNEMMSNPTVIGTPRSWQSFTHFSSTR